MTVGDPAEGVLAYRDAPMRRGVLVSGIDTPRILTNAVKITDARIEYLGGSIGHAISGEPVRVVIAYDAAEPVEDIVFAINIYDRQGNLLLGTNSELLGFDPGPASGRGEVAFELGAYPSSTACTRCTSAFTAPTAASSTTIGRARTSSRCSIPVGPWASWTSSPGWSESATRAGRSADSYAPRSGGLDLERLGLDLLDEVGQRVGRDTRGHLQPQQPGHGRGRCGTAGEEPELHAEEQVV